MHHTETVLIQSRLVHGEAQSDRALSRSRRHNLDNDGQKWGLMLFSRTVLVRLRIDELPQGDIVHD
jgi:hypothetical protein